MSMTSSAFVTNRMAEHFSHALMALTALTALTVLPVFLGITGSAMGTL